MKDLLAERGAAIIECFSASFAPVECDADQLRELLRQAAELDWDAGYCSASEGDGLAEPLRNGNPWRPT